MKHFYLLLFSLLSNSLFAQTKVGVVNSNIVLNSLPYRDSMIKVIGKIEEDGVQELISMDSLLQVKVTCQTARDCTLTLGDQIQENTIRSFQLKIVEREKEIDSILNKLSDEVNNHCLAITKKAIETVSKEMELTMTIDSSLLHYYEETIDITEQVIQQALK